MHIFKIQNAAIITMLKSIHNNIYGHVPAARNPRANAVAMRPAPINPTVDAMLVLGFGI